MEGKLCVTKVEQENIEGVFVANKREELVRIPRSMIATAVSPGNVLRVDYSWRSVAVFETLPDKFFPVTAEVVETVKFNHIQIADSQEAADAAFKARLPRDYQRLRKALEEDDYVTSEGIEVKGG